jgi:transposase-like protein
MQYLNNVVKQDHSSRRIRPMLGFKRFETAAVTIRGIPVSRENQERSVQPRKAGGKPATAPETWVAVLAA